MAATLATLNSGTASSLIKQDLKLIIQSRRKAEGKSELQVEFKKPVKEEQLTSEEVSKRSRRRELNRLAARRSREKGQKRKDMLVEEIRKLQTHNCELMESLSSLTEQRNQIIDTLRQHMKQCSDYEATQKASVGLSHRVLTMLGVHASDELESQGPPPQLATSVPPVSIATVQPSLATVADVSGMSALYISTSGMGSSPSKLTMSPSSIKTELGSCVPSPQVLNLDKISGSLSNFSQVKNEPASPFLDPSVTGVDVDLCGKKFHPGTKSSTSTIQVLLQPPETSLSAQVFLVSSSEIVLPHLLSSPSKTRTTPLTLDSSNLSRARLSSETETRSKRCSGSLPSFQGALNFQVPILKDGLPLVPIRPKPGKVYQRRNSVTSLSGSSDEGMATLLPHSAVIGSIPSPKQSTPSDSGLGSSQEEGGDGIGEEVVQYKHKLMKHRKQHSTDFTHPSRYRGLVSEGQGYGGRPPLLERSFSFPSSRSEDARSSSETFSASTFPSSSQVSSTSLSFPQYNSSKITSTFVSSSVITDKFISEALPAKSLSSTEDQSALTLGSKKLSSILKPHDSTPRSGFLSDSAMDEDKSVNTEGELKGWASPMDTWPPAGSSRSAHLFQKPERRWSVDDFPARPLNLSRQGFHDDIDSLVESSHRTALSRSSSPVSLPERKSFG